MLLLFKLLVFIGTMLAFTASVVAETSRPVGFVVPLSGKYAPLGKAMQDAATMALFDKQALTPDIPPITLLPRDAQPSGQTSGQTIVKTVQNLSKQQPLMLIGPLLGSQTRELMPLYPKHTPPILSFSNQEDVAKPGIYLFGYSAKDQIEQLLDEALRSNKMLISAALPNDPYGRSIATHLRYAASVRGIQLAPIAFYRLEDDQSIPTDALQQALQVVQQGERPRFPDAILLVEQGARMADIAAYIKARRGTTYIQLMGLQQWEDPELWKQPAMRLAWFSASPRKYYERFQRRFQAVYGYTPPPVAGLAYDATILAADIAKSGSVSTADLTRSGGYIGVATGAFRLLEDGTSERLLAIIEIGSGGVVRERRPAPAAFNH